LICFLHGRRIVWAARGATRFFSIFQFVHANCYAEKQALRAMDDDALRGRKIYYGCEVENEF
jgi:hypothetical protein